MKPRPLCWACADDRGTVHLAPARTGAVDDKTYVLIECATCGSLRLDGSSSPDDAYEIAYYAHVIPDENRTRHFPAFLSGMDLSIFLTEYTRFEACTGTAERAEIIQETLQQALYFYLGGLDKDAHILDVGAGTGDLVYWLRAIGYHNVIGIDPLVPGDVMSGGALLVHRMPLGNVSERNFDLIVFNHSLEHAPDPLAELEAARERLSPAGRILVRLPVAGCHAWRTYGVDWCSSIFRVIASCRATSA